MWKKVALGVFGVVALLVVGVVVYFYALHPKVATPRDLKAPSTPEAIERGRYLAEHLLGCVACHSEIDESRPGDFIKEDTRLSGRVFPQDPDFPGTLVGPNLTPDPETGLGAWTDGEIVRAIREGISRDGTPLFPIMNYPAYRMLPDEDVLAVVAYLRTARPIRRELPRSKVDFPVSMFIRLAPKPVEGSPPPLPTETLPRGRALLQLMSCKDCHTPMEKGEFVEGKEMAGGMCFKGDFGKVCAPNISSHPAAGIGSMSDDDLMRVFREGRGKDGRTLWVMPWSVTKGATDEDLRALIAALREIPPQTDLVPARELKAGL
ncbi:MAG: hypothetical protein AMXMBFR64_54320 [Myxococcales bacterium]